MTQRYDGHPPMSKSQLQEYLESLRDDPSRSHSRTQSTGDTTDSRGSTPLVRALKERYGSTNSTPTYVDVGISKGKEVPTKRALPPVPAPKSSASTGWRIKDQNQQEPRQPERQEEVPYSRVRSSSPTKRNDFWSTGIVRPLPSTPRTGSDWPLTPDPRDELQLDQLSLKDATSSRSPSIDVSNTNIPLISAPSISVASINVPSVKVPSSTSPEPVSDEPDKPTKSWPNVHVRSKSSPMLLCALCNKPIAGRIVTAVGSRFHPDCFRCTTCNTELEHVAFYEHDGKVYCHLDYHELFSPRCKHCDTPIENEVISALGNKYHPGHFFCAGCGDPFGATTPFIVRDKYPWCERCYENKYAPKCAKCRKPILDEVLNAMGKSWHPSGCFVCKECGRDFGDDGFFVDATDSKPICKSCKHIKLVRQVEKIRP